MSLDLEGYEKNEKGFISNLQWRNNDLGRVCNFLKMHDATGLKVCKV